MRCGTGRCEALVRWRSTCRERTRVLLEDGAPKRVRDQAWRAPAGRTGERGAPGRVREQRVRECDRVLRADAEGAAMREIVHRARDDREPDGVELAQQRRDRARQRAIDEGLEQ